MASLAQTHPALADQWVTLGDGKTPYDVTAGSAYRATWKCSVCLHTWTAVTYSRTRGSGCPQCKRSIISANRSRPRPGQSLAEKYPHIAAEWDNDRNERTAGEVSAHARMVARWVCAACGHRWANSVSNRTRNGDGNACPACFAARHSAHMRVTVGGATLAEALPEVAAQWNQAAPENADATPSTVRARSGIPRAWLCSCGHEWVSTPASRSLGYGCARCRQRIGSAQEAAMLDGVRRVWPHASPGSIRRYSAATRRQWSVDAMDDDARLVFEFDGSYWHSEAANPGARRRDIAKSQDLRRQGWTVVRVRESPLEPTHLNDLIVPFGCTGGDLAARVADHARTFLPALGTRV